MAQPVSPTIEKQELTPDQTKYIKREELEEVLKKTFGDGLDFNVSVRPTYFSLSYLTFVLGQVSCLSVCLAVNEFFECENIWRHTCCLLIVNLEEEVSRKEGRILLWDKADKNSFFLIRTQTKSSRWIYYAKRKLSDKEVRFVLFSIPPLLKAIFTINTTDEKKNKQINKKRTEIGSPNLKNGRRKRRRWPLLLLMGRRRRDMPARVVVVVGAHDGS